MDSADVALLVLTAEDEQADGRKVARLNVVHEVGLFQGRLGFERAIVLLKDGCEEFSNIEGLSQIRFPSATLRATRGERGLASSRVWRRRILLSPLSRAAEPGLKASIVPGS